MRSKKMKWIKKKKKLKENKNERDNNIKMPI